MVRPTGSSEQGRRDERLDEPIAETRTTPMERMRCEVRVTGHQPATAQEGIEEFARTEAPPRTVMVGEALDTAHVGRRLARVQSLGPQVLSLRDPR